jgi:hypothetical protein
MASLEAFMFRLKRTLLVALALTFCNSPLVYAGDEQSGQSGQQGQNGQRGQSAEHRAAKKKSQLMVLSTFTNRKNGTLTIKGVGFGHAAAPGVWCETSPMTVLSASDSELVVDLPAEVTDGTYLLTVARGITEVERGAFNMSVAPSVEQAVTVSGAKGDTGAVGPQGPVGPVGPAGADGLKGEQGPVGPAGPAGPKGDQGSDGPQGATGAAGLTGASGPQGLQGQPGAAGPQGDAGAAGQPGPMGPMGMMGPQGAAGAQGAAGSQGPAGPAGAQGAAGPQGAQGAAGISGYEIVSYTHPSALLASNASLDGKATCPAGKRVLGGGVEPSNLGTALIAVASAPLGDNAWKVTLRLMQSQSSNVGYKVYAICATIAQP